MEKKTLKKEEWETKIIILYEGSKLSSTIKKEQKGMIVEGELGT